MASHIKRHKIQKDIDINVEGGFFREMQKKDIPQVYKLLKDYLSQFKLAPKYKQEEVAHLLLPKKDVVYTYVVESGDTKEVTDFVSFYRLPSQILNKEEASGHSEINVSLIHTLTFIVRLSLI